MDFRKLRPSLHNCTTFFNAVWICRYHKFKQAIFYRIILKSFAVEDGDIKHTHGDVGQDYDVEKLGVKEADQPSVPKKQKITTEAPTKSKVEPKEETEKDGTGPKIGENPKDALSSPGTIDKTYEAVNDFFSSFRRVQILVPASDANGGDSFWTMQSLSFLLLL